MGRVGGGNLLSRSETGRNILSAEIVVGTAIATFYRRGCGAAPAGALAGEIIGGASGSYAAYQAGGDISSGIFFGVVAGGISGASISYFPVTLDVIKGTTWYLSSNFWYSVGIGAAKGAIAGASLGAT